MTNDTDSSLDFDPTLPSYTLKRSTFAGTCEEWLSLRATAAFITKTSREEIIQGNSFEIWDAINSEAADKKKAPYGEDVPYADPGYIGGVKRYPLNCARVKSAWGYINHKKNADRYTPEQLAHVRGKIIAAYKRCFGEEPPSLEKSK